MGATPLLLSCFLSSSVGDSSEGDGATDPEPAGPAFRVYRSGDQGRTWAGVGRGLPTTERIHAFLVDGATVYAGTDGGLFRSVDGGYTWSRLAFPTGAPVQCLAANRRLYAGTKNAGVLVSDDQGRTWSQTAKNLATQNVRALAVLGETVFAGTDAGGVFALRDGEDSWTPAGQGLPRLSQVFDLGVKGRALYAALYSKGLYRLDLQTRRWTSAGNVAPLRFVVHGDALLAGHNPGGVHRSVDRGATWSRGRGLSLNAPIWVLGNAGPNLLAGTSPGALFRSEDFGASWRPSATGLPPGCAVVAIGSASDYALVATLEGVKTTR